MSSRPTSPAREVETVADRLHAAAIHLSRRLRAEDDALGISPPRLSALSVVVFSGPLQIGALAAAEAVAAPTMTRLIDGLERDGLVARGRDPDDGRAVIVRATAEGIRILRRGQARRIEALARGLSSLTPTDLRAVARGMDALDRMLTSDA